MSKGSKIVPIRIPAAEYEKLLLSVLGHPGNRKKNPKSVGEFIRTAIREKIAHLGRSKRKKGVPLPLVAYEFRDVNGSQIMCVKMPCEELAGFLESNPDIDHYIELLDV
jgi:hypothetical protein